MAKQNRNGNKGGNRFETGKTKQRVAKPTPIYPMDFPDTLSRDALAEMSDDELAKRLDVLHGEIETVTASSKELSVQPWEVEICYTHRELGARIGRRQAHEKYTGRAAGAR